MDARVDEIENRWSPLSMPWSVDVICVDEDTGEYKDEDEKGEGRGMVYRTYVEGKGLRKAFLTRRSG